MLIELNLSNSEKISLEVLKYNLEILDCINEKIQARFSIRFSSISDISKYLKLLEQNINKSIYIDKISKSYKNIILDNISYEDIQDTYCEFFLYVTMEE